MLIENKNEVPDEDGYIYTRPSPINEQRWESLKNRVFEEHSKGISLDVLSEVAVVDTGRLLIWLKAPNESAWMGRTIGEKGASERIAEAFEKYFAESAAKGLNIRSRCPVSVETSVNRAIFHSIDTARIMCEPVLIDAPPGIGKTEGIRRYMVQKWQTYGFDCPVWKIVLSESMTTVTAVLSLLAKAVLKSGHHGKNSDAAVLQAILDATRGKDGVLIIDEAQHMGDASKINGIRILNELRTLNDSGNFGMALFGNGEIYNRLGKSTFTQISSRVKPFRVEIAGLGKGKNDQPALTVEDVLLVMNAWGVEGVEFEKWCLRVAALDGALRNVVNGFRYSIRTYGRVNTKGLKESERFLNA